MCSWDNPNNLTNNLVPNCCFVPQKSVVFIHMWCIQPWLVSRSQPKRTPPTIFHSDVGTRGRQEEGRPSNQAKNHTSFAVVHVEMDQTISGNRMLSCLPSRERIHIPPWWKENHLQKCLGMGYVSFHEGNCLTFNRKIVVLLKHLKKERVVFQLNMFHGQTVCFHDVEACSRKSYRLKKKKNHTIGWSCSIHLVYHIVITYQHLKYIIYPHLQ